MTSAEFKAQVRENRGKLTHNEGDLNTIYVSGIEALKEFTLSKKLMGIKNIAWVAEKSTTYQTKFCNWMASKNWKATKNELELWAERN